MPWLSQHRWAASFTGLALGFSIHNPFTSLPETTMQHSLAMRKFMVKNDICGSSIFSPVLGAVSCKRDVALGWSLLWLFYLGWTQGWIYGWPPFSLMQPASFFFTLLCFALAEKWCHFSLCILKMDCNNGSHSCLMYCWNKFLEFMLLCKARAVRSWIQKACMSAAIFVVFYVLCWIQKIIGRHAFGKLSS